MSVMTAPAARSAAVAVLPVTRLKLLTNLRTSGVHRLVESVAAYGERSGKHEGAGLNAHLLGQGRQVDKRLLRIQFAEGQQEKGGKQRKMPKFHGRIKLVGLLRDKLHSGAKSVGRMNATKLALNFGFAVSCPDKSSKVDSLPTFIAKK